MAKKKQVVKKEKADVALLNEIQELEYTGMEEVDSSLLSIPFLKIAQPTTPQAQKGNPAHIEGLSPGMFYNSSSGKVYGEKVNVVFFGFSHQFLQWDEDAGSLEARFMPDDVQKMLDSGAMKKDGLSLTKDGNAISENYVMYTAVLDHLEDEILFFSFKSTGIKHFKKIIGKAYAETMKNKEGKVIKAPMFYCVWEIKPILNTNEKGQSWYLIGDKTTVTAKKQGTIDGTFKGNASAVLQIARAVKDLKQREKDFDLSETTERVVSEENPFT